MGKLRHSKEKELNIGAQAFGLSGTQKLLPKGTHILVHYKAPLARAGLCFEFSVCPVVQSHHPTWQ